MQYDGTYFMAHFSLVSLHAAFAFVETTFLTPPKVALLRIPVKDACTVRRRLVHLPPIHSFFSLLRLCALVCVFVIPPLQSSVLL